MPNIIDLKGRQFDFLTVLDIASERKSGAVTWHCVCECGKEVDVTAGNLKSRNTKSCGCHKLKIQKDSLLNIHKLKRDQIARYGTNPVMIAVNKTPAKNNTTGYVGVYVYQNTRYRAMIQFKKKLYHLGVYDKIEDAIKARKIAEEKLFGNFLSWYNEQKTNNSNEKQIV